MTLYIQYRKKVNLRFSSTYRLLDMRDEIGTQHQPHTRICGHGNIDKILEILLLVASMCY